MTSEFGQIEAQLDTTNLHKPRLLSAETVEVFCKSEMSDELDKVVDDTFQYNRFGTKNGYIFMILRVYFDIGFYASNQAIAAKALGMELKAAGVVTAGSSGNNSCNTM